MSPIWVEISPKYLKEQGLDAAFTEYEEEPNEKEPEKVGQPLIVLGRHPRGESVAHEVGHAVLGHRQEHFQTPEDMARNEMAAWVWAYRRRKARQGGRIRSNIVAAMALQLKKWFSDISLDETVNVIEKAYEANEVEPPDPDYVRRVVELVDERTGKWCG